jgi:hypothetical protein
MSNQAAKPGPESEPRTSILGYVHPNVARPAGPISAVNVVMGCILGLLFAAPFGFCVGVGKALDSGPGSKPVGRWVCMVIGGALFLFPLFVLVRHLDQKRHPGALAGAAAITVLSVIAAIVYCFLPN